MNTFTHTYTLRHSHTHSSCYTHAHAFGHDNKEDESYHLGDLLDLSMPSIDMLDFAK